MLASSVLFAVLAIFLATPSNALYFYLEGSEQKCFIEELPKETTVIGNYRSEEWNDGAQNYIQNVAIGIQIMVEELPSRHRVVNQKGPSFGRFTFTTSEAGDHAICLSTNTSGWFSTSKTRLHLDLLFGETSHDTTAGTKEVLSDLTMRVRDLNNRVNNIRREQQYQREREAEFRDVSESTNSRVVIWTLVQLFVLGITCLWQLRHLKQFFITKKLV
ncbi:emp24p/erv25p- protein [Quaeritorhiza haematococci]|nr:emp24p/erv25p- protein [Quaeritorhiza haematococci]